MASTSIELTKKDGKKLIYELTPSAKVAFESHFKSGWRRRLIDEQLESDLWWFAHYLQSKKGDTTLELGEAYTDQFTDIELVVDSKNG
jgi:hypothetical protein